MLTQIIAGEALECMSQLVHSYRRQHSIKQFCDCPEAIESNKAIEEEEAAVAAASGTNDKGICKVYSITTTLDSHCKTIFIFLFHFFPLESNCS